MKLQSKHHSILACLLLMSVLGRMSTVQGQAIARSEDGGVESAEQVVRAYITNFGGDGVSVVDPINCRLISHIPTGIKPHGVAIAPDGNAVYVSNEGDGTLSVIDPIKNEVVATINIGNGPNQVEVSADSRHVFVTLHEDGAVAVVEAVTRKVVEVVSVGRAPHIALRSPDGKTIYVTSEGDMKLVALDAQTWKVKAEIPLMAFPRVLAVTPDGKRVYLTIRWLNGALMVDPLQKKVVDRIALGEPIFAPNGKDAHGLAVTPNGSELWLTTQTSNDITIFDTKDHTILGRVMVGNNPNWVGFTPDGRRAVVSNTTNNDVSVVDVAQRTVVATVKVGPSPKRLAVGVVSLGALTEPVREDFDSVAKGKLPQGWRVEATNSKGRLAEWSVGRSGSAPSNPNVLSLTEIKDSFGGVFNLFWTAAPPFRDGTIEVKLRANTGVEDQGGGLIWRVMDANNYYITRYNPLEGNFRLYFVKDGARKTLANAGGIGIKAGEWFTIRITHEGQRIEGWLNGEKLLEAEDSTFLAAGGTGLWTKADAATSFDDFKVMPAR